jgi:hypothetical protein
VVGRSGEVETRSMVYNEYFVRGTQPTEYCQLHSGQGVFATFAGLFSEKPPRPRLEETGGAPAAPSTTATASTISGPVGTTGEAAPPSDIAPLPPESPAKKRGFWSRILGRGSRDKN